MKYMIEYYTNNRLIRFEKSFNDLKDAQIYKVAKQEEGARFKIFRQKII